MRKMIVATVTSVAAASLLSGCAGIVGGAAISNKAMDHDAVKLATEACTTALGMNAEDFDVATDQRQGAAETAARAAAEDEKWDDLADAANEWAYWTKRVSDTDNLEDLDLASLQEMSSKVDDLKADLSRECRAVNAAGGTVPENLLADF